MTAATLRGLSMANHHYIRFRRDDSEMWFLRNPILREGEPGFESDSKRIKVGDGQTRWNDLPYIGQTFPSSLVRQSRFRTIKMRRDSQVNWATSNPTLGEGEPGFEMDTRLIKVGDGSTVWNSLPYLGQSASTAPEVVLPGNLVEHVNSPNPHPVYDDGPSLALLYQNAKV